MMEQLRPSPADTEISPPLFSGKTDTTSREARAERTHLDEMLLELEEDEPVEMTSVDVRELASQDHEERTDTTSGTSDRFQSFDTYKKQQRLQELGKQIAEETPEERSLRRIEKELAEARRAFSLGIRQFNQADFGYGMKIDGTARYKKTGLREELKRTRTYFTRQDEFKNHVFTLNRLKREVGRLSKKRDLIKRGPESAQQPLPDTMRRVESTGGEPIRVTRTTDSARTKQRIADGIEIRRKMAANMLYGDTEIGMSGIIGEMRPITRLETPKRPEDVDAIIQAARSLDRFDVRRLADDVTSDDAAVVMNELVRFRGIIDATRSRFSDRLDSEDLKIIAMLTRAIEEMQRERLKQGPIGLGAFEGGVVFDDSTPQVRPSVRHAEESLPPPPVALETEDLPPVIPTDPLTGEPANIISRPEVTRAATPWSIEEFGRREQSESLPYTASEDVISFDEEIEPSAERDEETSIEATFLRTDEVTLADPFETEVTRSEASPELTEEIEERDIIAQYYESLHDAGRAIERLDLREGHDLKLAIDALADIREEDLQRLLDQADRYIKEGDEESFARWQQDIWDDIANSVHVINAALSDARITLPSEITADHVHFVGELSRFFSRLERRFDHAAQNEAITEEPEEEHIDEMEVPHLDHSETIEGRQEGYELLDIMPGKELEAMTPIELTAEESRIRDAYRARIADIHPERIDELSDRDRGAKEAIYARVVQAYELISREIDAVKRRYESDTVLDWHQEERQRDIDTIIAQATRPQPLPIEMAGRSVHIEELGPEQLYVVISDDEDGRRQQIDLTRAGGALEELAKGIREAKRQGDRHIARQLAGDEHHPLRKRLGLETATTISPDHVRALIDEKEGERERLAAISAWRHPTAILRRRAVRRNLEDLYALANRV